MKKAMALSPQKTRKQGRVSFTQFQLCFWLCAGLLLFFSGVSQGPIFVSLVRNLYYTAVGLGFTWLIATWLLQFFTTLVMPHRILSGSALCLFAGATLTMPINPVTFGQLGHSLSSLTLGHWFAGAFNYSLVLMVWMVLYFALQHSQSDHQHKQPITQTTKPHFAPMILAFQGQREISIPLGTIYYIKAAGDYVEIITVDGQRIKRATLKTLTSQLDPNGFLRVHRSILINTHLVKAVEVMPKGVYCFRFDGGHKVLSSRSFAKIIQVRFFPGELP